MQSRGRRWASWVGRWVVAAALLVAMGYAVGRATGFSGAWGVSVGVGGAVVGLFGSRRRSETMRRGAPPGLTSEQRGEAWRASRTGPVPVDPAVRREAARLARARTVAAGTESAHRVVLG